MSRMNCELCGLEFEEHLRIPRPAAATGEKAQTCQVCFDALGEYVRLGNLLSRSQWALLRRLRHGWRQEVRALEARVQDLEAKLAEKGGGA